MKSTRMLLTVLALALFAIPSLSNARTKLVTLPERADLIVNLQNPNYSLLTEEREVTLQKGNNTIDFSWSGVSIDKSSIHLTPLTHPGDGDDATKIISIGYPPNEDALTWLLYTPEARTERIRVTYLLYGIEKSSSYEMTVNQAEDQALFLQYFEMSNGSGEDLDDAAIRLHANEDWTRSVDANETRKFLSFKKKALPVNKLYITRPNMYSSRGEDGEIISMVYEINNTAEGGLGQFKLTQGKARIFGEENTGSTIFLGEDYMAETPVKEDAKLTLGTVKDILLKRRIMSDKRENQRKNTSDRVVMYDRKVHVRYEIENFKDKTSTVRVVETLPKDAVLLEIDKDGVTVERKSATELEITIELEPRPEDSGEEVPVREINFMYEVPDVIA
ncbi:hypothetical protein KQI84_10635 [bacterium]|nr:hypothetical protein [bacterium]